MSKYIKTIEIENYDQLADIIKGKTEYCEDLRDKFIFRGLSNVTYELIPSALREDGKLDDFVDENFKLNLSLNYKKALELGFVDKEDKYCDVKSFTVDKYCELTSGEKQDFVNSIEKFHFKKEINALINFLNYADKVGLKIPINQEIREQIGHNVGHLFDYDSSWPCPDFYELIALAQHYGVPTRALDWSYDYNVALYFAVRDILKLGTNVNQSNGILWAFNYEGFDRGIIICGKKFYFTHYRPEYNSNPNLNAQKGLFTFIIDYLDEITREPFDKYIDDYLNKEGNNRRVLKGSDIAFYKFIIPAKIKPLILKELYSDGYSEEYLFPGYDGVAKAVKNRIKLDKILNLEF